MMPGKKPASAAERTPDIGNRRRRQPRAMRRRGRTRILSTTCLRAGARRYHSTHVAAARDSSVGFHPAGLLDLAQPQLTNPFNEAEVSGDLSGAAGDAANPVGQCPARAQSQLADYSTVCGGCQGASGGSQV